MINENMLREYSALVFAYIGDAVFELAVRTHVVLAGNRKVKDLHHDTVEMVKAESQAQFIREIYNELSEEEQDIVMRGRNSKSTPPKHADPRDYQLSTGFEALLGYLYLKGDEKRLEELVEKVLNRGE
ncbi:MAG: Mini-ribonuclease 3 [Syntrophomonadaceae bacterium]|nr:Mini-ribonuclease 3 [Syntrophomonadaceae bacterium]